MSDLKNSFLQRLANTTAQFFSSRAKLSLVVLLLLCGLVIGLGPISYGFYTSQKNLQPPASGGTRSGASESAQSNRCNQVILTFSRGATVDQISVLLERLESSIVFGPNENGSFELLVPFNKANEVVDALNRADEIVVVASKRNRCL